MNKTVVLDCDGALLDFVTPYIKFIHSLGYTHVSNDIKSFYFLKDYGFAPEQSKNIFKQFVAQGGFRNLKSYPGTIDLFAYLKEAGYKVVLATNVPRMGHQDRINNLKDLGLEYDEIVFGPNKHKVVLDHKASLILEDHPEAIVACHEHTEATVACVRWPYNSYIKFQGRLLDLGGHPEALLNLTQHLRFLKY